MAIPHPFPGLVIRYSFLWSHEYRRGQVEGVKDRPCTIVLVTSHADNGRHVATVAPITHTPKDERRGVLLPPKVSRHLGLDDNASWIALDEMNRFIWPGPDLRPLTHRGPGVWTFGILPRETFEQMKLIINELRAERGIKVAPRDDDSFTP